MPNSAPERQLDSYDLIAIEQRILFETRQAELDALRRMTGEVLVNEYARIPVKSDLVA